MNDICELMRWYLKESWNGYDFGVKSFNDYIDARFDLGHAFYNSLTNDDRSALLTRALHSRGSRIAIPATPGEIMEALNFLTTKA